ncbi:hypothetical protein GGP57_001238 [Salinibacter ruber]|uniref:hypothetical protein n=1 Tax=Salinibacter ruber TaxID=146919 RepID=UPI0021696F49|nr:hypothetical protein [Salinibacter ruber]MCS3633947.1 hypothetical protein [Salinibacter ruber]MCS3712277.1 hypothetical protein [Salinibacter ruber]
MSEFLGGLSLSLRALSPRQALSPSAPAPETVHSIERRWRSGTPGGQESGGITPPAKEQRRHDIAAEACSGRFRVAAAGGPWRVVV